MKRSFGIHFLGWLLTGQNWLATGENRPQLSIVSPEHPITQGAIVTIDCNPAGYTQIFFELYKEVPPRSRQPEWQRKRQQKERTFYIPNAETTDGGLYVCRFCKLQSPYGCSVLSNSVKIFITEQRYSAPSLSASPSTVATMGENIILSCKSDQQPTAKFRLYKDGSLSDLAAKKEEENEAAFHIASATRSVGGIYQCNYCHSTEFFEICSHYSNSTPVFIRDPSLRKPSLEARPSQEVAPGLNFTIECQGPAKDLNISLYKSSTLIASQMTEPDGNTTKFSFSKANVDSTGNYSCQYRSTTGSFVWSLPSNLIQIVMRDEDSDSSLPKPTLKLRPEESTTLGWSVSIECQGPESGLNFALQQPSNSTSLWLMESTGNSTKFSLAQVRLEDGGNYTCRYRHRARAK